MASDGIREGSEAVGTFGQGTSYDGGVGSASSWDVRKAKGRLPTPWGFVGGAGLMGLSDGTAVCNAAVPPLKVTVVITSPGVSVALLQVMQLGWRQSPQARIAPVGRSAATDDEDAMVVDRLAGRSLRASSRVAYPL